MTIVHASEDRRQHDRARLPLLRVRCRNGLEFEDQMLFDVSAEGAFVRTSETLPVGSLVELQLLVGNAREPIQARARVIRVRVGGGPTEDGMVLEFEGLAAEVTTDLELVVSQIVESAGALVEVLEFLFRRELIGISD